MENLELAERIVDVQILEQLERSTDMTKSNFQAKLISEGIPSEKIDKITDLVGNIFAPNSKVVSDMRSHVIAPLRVMSTEDLRIILAFIDSDVGRRYLQCQIIAMDSMNQTMQRVSVYIASKVEEIVNG